MSGFFVCDEFYYRVLTFFITFLLKNLNIKYPKIPDIIEAINIENLACV